VRLHDLELGLVLAELDPQDVIGIGEGEHRPPEMVPHLRHHRYGKSEAAVTKKVRGGEAKMRKPGRPSFIPHRQEWLTYGSPRCVPVGYSAEQDRY